ncbi:MAG: polysaccharide deacetylase family protein [Gemmatimonadales bacterium]|nr:polysaccharide deacetylase family protein [Gemmatimonadales bacterium]
MPSIARLVGRLGGSAVGLAPVGRLALHATGVHGCVFFLHRFHEPGREPPGDHPALLAANLAWLRRIGVDLVTVETIVRAGLEGRVLPRPSVAFTIDDGYRDFLTVAAPVFERYDCPATVFLATEFLDRRRMLWWDRVEWIVLGTRRPRLTLAIGAHHVDEAVPAARSGRTALAARCSRAMEHVADTEKVALIDALAAQLEVEVPAEAPEAFAPLTWDEVRALHARGFQFAPHTVTHPILAQTSDAQCADEVATSVRRLREEVARPTPILAYPNGRPYAFGLREERVVAENGLLAAVTTDGAWLRRGVPGPDAPFRVGRVPYFEEPYRFRASVLGLFGRPSPSTS